MTTATSAISDDAFTEHLQQARSDAEAAAKPKPARDPDAGLRQRVWSFDFDYTDGQGKKYSGKFTNQILNIGQRIKVDTVRTALQQGQPVDSFSDAAFELLYIVTWMAESLTQKPEWAGDLTNLYDVEIVQALFANVQRHEQAFRGRDPNQKEGQGAA